MNTTDFIALSYIVTFTLILWLIVSTWIWARKVQSALDRDRDHR